MRLRAERFVVVELSFRPGKEGICDGLELRGNLHAFLFAGSRSGDEFDFL